MASVVIDPAAADPMPNKKDLLCMSHWHLTDMTEVFIRGAKLLDVVPSEKKPGAVALTFDRSIFHPHDLQGGTQEPPTNLGTITISGINSGDDSSVVAKVFFVRSCAESGRVLHDAELVSPQEDKAILETLCGSTHTLMDLDVEMVSNSLPPLHSTLNKHDDDLLPVRPSLHAAIVNCGFVWAPKNGVHGYQFPASTNTSTSTSLRLRTTPYGYVDYVPPRTTANY